MESEELPRKLAAILYADVAGQVMHYAGDAVLAMFEAVVDAAILRRPYSDRGAVALPADLR